MYVAINSQGYITSEIPADLPWAIEVPDLAKIGDRWIDNELIPSTEIPTKTKVSPIEFKLLFTSTERIAIKAAKATDPILEDAFEILDDPRLTYVDLTLTSNKNLVGYLALQNLIAPERVAEILTGVIS